MKHWRIIAILAAWGAADSQTALASGVGLTQPQRPAVVPVSYQACGSACGPNTSCGCGPLGAACIDGATPPPCSADGVCIPKSSTFGHYNTRWRRWPGDIDDQQPTPLEATEQDELLKPFDTPPPEKEDQQAPPPIEEDPGNTSAQEEEDLPPLEIDLPPLPEQRPFDPPFPPAGEGPPAPPFGMKPSNGPSMTWRAKSNGEGFREVRRLPELPADRVRTDDPGRARQPRTADRNGDTPPPLPGGFTMHSEPSLPAIGRSARPRFDSAVRQVSATGPARLDVDR